MVAVLYLALVVAGAILGGLVSETRGHEANHKCLWLTSNWRSLSVSAELRGVRLPENITVKGVDDDIQPARPVALYGLGIFEGKHFARDGLACHCPFWRHYSRVTRLPICNGDKREAAVWRRVIQHVNVCNVRKASCRRLPLIGYNDGSRGALANDQIFDVRSDRKISASLRVSYISTNLNGSASVPQRLPKHPQAESTNDQGEGRQKHAPQGPIGGLLLHFQFLAGLVIFAVGLYLFRYANSDTFEIFDAERTSIAYFLGGLFLSLLGFGLSLSVVIALVV